MGVRIDSLTQDAVIAAVLNGLECKTGGWIITLNLDQLRQINQNSELKRLINAADLIVADGMPLVWVSRLVGSPLPERVAGHGR